MEALGLTLMLPIFACSMYMFIVGATGSTVGMSWIVVPLIVSGILCIIGGKMLHKAWNYDQKP